MLSYDIVTLGKAVQCKVSDYFENNVCCYACYTYKCISVIIEFHRFCAPGNCGPSSTANSASSRRFVSLKIALDFETHCPLLVVVFTHRVSPTRKCVLKKPTPVGNVIQLCNVQRHHIVIKTVFSYSSGRVATFNCKLFLFHYYKSAWRIWWCL